MSYGKIFPLGGSGGLTSPSGIAGAIQFSNGSAFASDASNLFWDDTNNRLGVGTNAPSATTHIVGSGNTSATTALILQNSSGLEMLKVTNDSKFKIIPTALMPDVLFIEDFRFPGEKVLQLGTRNNAGHGAISSRSRMFIDAGIGASGEYLIINSASGNNVGINETTPTAKLHIKGSGSTSATTSLLVQNSAGTEAVRVRDDGAMVFNGTGAGGPYNIQSSTNNLSFSTGFYYRFFTTGDNKIVFGSGYDGVNTYAYFQNKAIVGTDALPNASAQFQVDSTTRGFLPPRMLQTQRTAIASPAVGLIVYQTDATEGLYIYKSTGWTFIV